jgi:uncharacterized protein with HEPN domain
MTFLVERLAQLRRHLDHLRELRPRVPGRAALERLPGFRNVLIHEYVALDLERVVEALNDLEPIEEFARLVRASIADSET